MNRPLEFKLSRIFQGSGGQEFHPWHRSKIFHGRASLAAPSQSFRGQFWTFAMWFDSRWTVWRVRSSVSTSTTEYIDFIPSACPYTHHGVRTTRPTPPPQQGRQPPTDAPLCRLLHMITAVYIELDSQTHTLANLCANTWRLKSANCEAVCAADGARSEAGGAAGQSPRALNVS